MRFLAGLPCPFLLVVGNEVVGVHDGGAVLALADMAAKTKCRAPEQARDLRPAALFGFSAMGSTGTGSFVSTHLSPGLRPPCDGGLFHNHDLPSRPIRTSGVSAGGAALPNFLRTRSVDQVGRKSETTLRIASLHFEISTFSGTATDQFELPSGAPDACHRQWG